MCTGCGRFPSRSCFLPCTRSWCRSCGRSSSSGASSVPPACTGGSSPGVLGLAYGAASLVFHGIMGSPLGAAVPLGGHVPAWILAVTVACLAKWSVDTGLVLPALKSSYPGKVREMLLGGEALQNDVAELCVAVLVTLAVAVSLPAIVFAVPLVVLLQRSFRHAQLVTASRIDSKTGLLNAATWERESAGRSPGRCGPAPRSRWRWWTSITLKGSTIPSAISPATGR